MTQSPDPWDRQVCSDVTSARDETTGLGPRPFQNWCGGSLTQGSRVSPIKPGTQVTVGWAVTLWRSQKHGFPLGHTQTCGLWWPSFPSGNGGGAGATSTEGRPREAGRFLSGQRAVPGHTSAVFAVINGL